MWVHGARRGGHAAYADAVSILVLARLFVIEIDHGRQRRLDDEADVISWIYAFIDRPKERFAQGSAFWATVTGTGLSARRGADGEFVTLLSPEGDACLKLQAVHDSGGAHLDLAVEDVPRAVTNAQDLGATVVAPHPGWAVMQSPGGQLFCLVPWRGEARRPPAVVCPDGASSRLDQVCIDVAPAAYDAEVLFWKALTGWDLHRGALPEFDLLKSPAALPIQILLQRLGDERSTSAHLDLACSGVDSTRSWHEQCGARLVGRGPLWLVMEDPAGGTYGLTMRDPRTGGLPAWALSRV
jgi:hypothetical protein